MKNTYKTLILSLLVAASLGCGYSHPKATMPTIAQLNPASETAGGVQFQLEIDGTNFATNAVVTFNGQAVSTTSAGSTKLDATIPASAITNTGTVPVTVTNPGSSGVYGGMGSVTSAALNFTIN
jgi:hypothetical protein